MKDPVWYYREDDSGEEVVCTTLSAMEHAERAYEKALAMGHDADWLNHRLHHALSNAKTVTARVRLAAISSVYWSCQ